MYCRKCGKEITTNTNFCPECGAQLSPDIPTESQGAAVNSLNWEKAKSNLKASTAELGDKAKLYIANIVALVLSLIFASTPIFEIGALGVSQGIPLFLDEYVDGMGSVKFICIVMYIISIGSLALPLLQKKQYKKQHFLLSKITTVLLTLYFLYVLIGASNAKGSDSLGSLASFSLTVTGWLFMVSTAAALILAFMNSSKCEAR